jgi:glucan phosphoethanolaminetransferase (alkaline phosphatase superfamily)
MKNKFTHRFIIGTFVSLYVVVSLISTIHVIDFFKLSNPDWLAVSLAIAFEIGAAASLSALIVLDKMNKWMVWSVFIILALMQMMGNTYYAYTNLQEFSDWSELFGLNEEELITQKRILSIISGAILPIIALGFIKSLVDYIRPKSEVKEEKNEDPLVAEVLTTEQIETEGEEKVEETVINDQIEIKDGHPHVMSGINIL